MRQYGWSWGLCDHPVGIGGAAGRGLRRCYRGLWGVCRIGGVGGRGLRRCYRDCGVSVGSAVRPDAACTAATGIVRCLSDRRCGRTRLAPLLQDCGRLWDWRCGWTRLAPLLQGLWGVCRIGSVSGRGLRRCYGDCGVSVGLAGWVDAACAAATGIVGVWWVAMVQPGPGMELFCSSGASRVGGAWGWPAASPYGFCGGLIAPGPADRAGRAIPALD